MAILKPNRISPLLIFISCMGLLSSCSDDDKDENTQTVSNSFPSSTDIPGFCALTTAENAFNVASAAQNLVNNVGSTDLVFGIEDDQKYTWSVLPVPVVTRVNQGARMGDLSAAQIALVCELLDASFPDLGVGAIAGGMSSDEVLGNTTSRPDRDYTKDNYWISIFGDPSGTDKWGYQIEGHHLGVNITVKGSDMVVGPFLFGGFPLEDESGVPLLDEQINAMVAFAAGLNSTQHTDMIIGNTPSEVDVDSKDISYSFLEPSQDGLLVSAMDDTQKNLLWGAIDSYFGLLPFGYADTKRAELVNVFDNAIVSWEGSTTAKPFGFQFYSSVMHIVFSNEDDADHAHCLIRFPGDDYGENL